MEPPDQHFFHSMRDEAFLGHIKLRTWRALIQICGGDDSCKHKTNESWRKTLREVASSTVFWSQSPSTNGNDAKDVGKPWDVEIRTAPAVFHRFRQDRTGPWIVTSNLGLKRCLESPRAVALLLAPLVEDTGYPCDVLTNLKQPEAGGLLCVVSPERSRWLRDVAGRSPCPYCVHWFRGNSGLWWHIQQQHEVAHERAKEAAEQTSEGALGSCSRAIVVLGDGTGRVGTYTTGRSDHAHAQVDSGSSVGSKRPRPSPFVAARDGDLEALRYAIEHDGFAVDSSLDSHGSSVLHWAAGGGHVAIVRYLLKLPAPESVDNDDSIQCGDDTPRIMCLLDCNKPQQARRSFGGRTALHWAARKGHLEVVRCLVTEFGANIEATTTDGTTAFCWAAWQGHLGILKFLWEHTPVEIEGANKRRLTHSAVNSFGCNACLWAAQGNADRLTLEWLRGVLGLEAVMVVNHNGHSVRHKAAQRGHEPICTWFWRLLGESFPGVTSAIPSISFASNDVQLIFQLLGPDSDGCLASDLAGMEGNETLAQVLAKQEMDLANTIRISLTAVNERGNDGAYTKLPDWIRLRPEVVHKEMVWEAGAGVSRMATCFHDLQP